MNIERLEKLGFTNASNELKRKQEMKRKMMMAYEHFRYVKQEKIDAFNAKLKEKSMKEDKYNYTYDTLSFIPVANYGDIPPTDVLTKIEEAQEIGCFDNFEIAKIKSVKEVKDPIVFGRINGCSDRFFIAQWDDDVKIEDILLKNEG